MTTIAMRVEIDWDNGYRFPMASRSWTDISAYVEAPPVVDSYGRSDEFSTADANDLTLILDNSTGVFTWGSNPSMRLGRAIRVVANVNGVDHVRYTGYVHEIPTAWPGGRSNYAIASLKAVSRLGRINKEMPLKDPRRVGVPVTMRAVACWPLTETSGRSAANRALGDAIGPLQATGKVTFGGGDGPGGIDDKVVLIGDEGRLSVQTAPEAFSVGPSFGMTLAFWFRDGGSASTPWLASLSVSGHHVLVLATSTSIAVDFNFPGVGFDFLSAPATPFDGNARHVLACYRMDTPTTFITELYIDGVLAASGSGARLGMTSPAVGSIALAGGTGSSQFLGAISDACVFNSGNITPDIAAYLAEAPLPSQYEGQTTDERLTMLGVFAGVPSSEVIAASSPITLVALPADSTSKSEMIRAVEAAESGVLYDDREGNLVLQVRTARYQATPTLTVDAALDLVGVDFSPKVDYSGLVNVATGKGPGEEAVEVTYSDELSREENGDGTATVETTAQDPLEPLMLAAALVNANADPRPRAPSVTLKARECFDAGIGDDVLALDIGSMVRLTNLPAQAPSATEDYFVEGYSETLDPLDWSIALNLSPAWPQSAVFVLDDATAGELDAGFVLAL